MFRVGIRGDVGVGVGDGIHNDVAVGLKVVVHFCLIVTFRDVKNLLVGVITSITNHHYVEANRRRNLRCYKSRQLGFSKLQSQILPIEQYKL